MLPPVVTSVCRGSTVTHTHASLLSLVLLLASFPASCWMSEHLYFLWCLRWQHPWPPPSSLSQLKPQLIRILQPLVGRRLVTKRGEGPHRASKCKPCLAHLTAGAIFVITRQIRIERSVMKVQKKRKKIDCDVLVFLSACSYLMKHK